MDDLLALEGGSAAKKWQRRHLARKKREFDLKQRRLARDAEKTDLRKRIAKWREACRIADAEGRKRPRRPNRRPHHAQILKLAGRRFGRLVVLRVAPRSKSRGKNRRWVCKCDCGTAERLVTGTSLMQGNSRSCGCLRSERVRQCWKSGRLAERQIARNRFKAAPLSIKLFELRFRILRKKPVTRTDSRLLSVVIKAMVEEEVRQGIRRRGKSGRPMLVKPAGLRPTIH